jgi:hypothetical protein
MNGDGMLSPFSVYLGPKKLRISSNELKRPDDTKMCAIDMSVTTLGRLPNVRDHRTQTTPATTQYTPKFRCIAVVSWLSQLSQPHQLDLLQILAQMDDLHRLQEYNLLLLLLLHLDLA